MDYGKKKEPKAMMGALKNYFKSNEMGEQKDQKEYKDKKLDKDARKRMAIIMIKKKMA